MEIEVKIEISNPEEIKKKLVHIGFESKGNGLHEYNVVFDRHEKTLRKNGLLLRLRKTGKRNVVTFKSPASTTGDTGNYKIREEIETEVGDFDIVKRIFLALGFEIFFIYEKFRQVYTQKGVKVMVDNTPIGDFIEIEGDIAAIDHTAKALGFDKNLYITESYYSLFKSRKGSGHMLF